MTKSNDMRTIKWIIMMGVAATLTSCGGQGNNQKATNERPGKSQANSEVLANYFEVKEALVKTDSKAASEAANKLLHAIGEEGEYADKIKTNAQHIAASNDIEHQRQHFSLLSEDVYQFVKSTTTNGQTLYLQHCPMAMENAGANWLSTSEEINNPYFGDKMLHCGSVKEVLRAN